MRLIDILNKIANGELKEGTKVKLPSLDDEYILSEYRGLVDEYGKDVFETYNFYVLNTEVELIEPNDFGKADKMAEPTDNNKIEELDILEIEDSQNIDNIGLANSIGDLRNEIREIQHKLNEVINKVNAQTTVVLSHEKDIEDIKEQLDY